jgi:beta-lactamase regulating signal transducer with metallopeptidase domain
MSDLVLALLRANLAASAAILAVLALRPMVRRGFGSESACWLWAAPPIVAIASLLPGRIAEEGAKLARGPELGHDVALALFIVWLVGVTATAISHGLGQAAFFRALKAGRAGPAVAGVICPRIVMPTQAGFYSDEERAVVRAHEWEHIARQDPRGRAVMAILQCLGWFNPLVHLAVHLARLDQELACDAAVVRRRPSLRALYARTLLKTQLATAPLPFGCHWPARGRHPLVTRIALLRSVGGERFAGALGPVMIAAGVMAGGLGVWMAQPPIPPLPPEASAPGAPAILAYIVPPEPARATDRGLR